MSYAKHLCALCPEDTLEINRFSNGNVCLTVVDDQRINEIILTPRQVSILVEDLQAALEERA